MAANKLDSVSRYPVIIATIRRKPLLKLFYQKSYERFKEILEATPAKGTIVELGAGGGFIKEIIPHAITTDVLPFPGIDKVVDATCMPFDSNSVRAFFLFDVFHHIPDVSAFFKEAQRCLIPNGTIFITDPYPGWVGYWIYRFVHHEPFNSKTKDWSFVSKGPISDANLALPWIVFKRDRLKFETEFSSLKIRHLSIHTPFAYWLSGGLSRWSLIPKKLVGLVFNIDQRLSNFFKTSGSFADIILEKH